MVRQELCRIKQGASELAGYKAVSGPRWHKSEMATMRSCELRSFRFAAENPCRNELSEKRRRCAYIDGELTSRVRWLSKRTPVPLVSLGLSLRSPRLATAMAGSDDRALGRVPAHGSDCGTLCRTRSFRVGALLLGLCRRWWCLRGWCLRGCR